MKVSKIILMAIFLKVACIASVAQVTAISFINLRNQGLRNAITNNIDRFQRGLVNFSSNDTLFINYDMKRASIFIIHNMNDERKAEIVYMNFLIYCAFIKSICPNWRFEFAKILVLHHDDRFMYADYSDLVFVSGTRRAKWYISNYQKSYDLIFSSAR